MKTQNPGKTSLRKGPVSYDQNVIKCKVRKEGDGGERAFLKERIACAKAL